MKATKKIVGAACALVAAVALSAGSTFAWFSTNGSVDATGMEIKVNTNNAYLIIANEAVDLKDEAKTITLVSSQTDLLPSAYWTKKASGDGYEDLTTKAASGTGSIVDSGSWYTGQGTSATNGTLVEDTVSKLTDTNFSQYVVVDEIYVAVSKGSTAIKEIEMSVTADPVWSNSNTTTPTTTGEGDEAVTTNVGNNNSAISVVILYQTIDEEHTTLGTWNIAELTAEGNDYGGANHKFTDGDVLKLGGLKPSQTYANYIQIRVMVYFDGNNADVNTANSANLRGVTLNFNFTDPAQAENAGTESGGESD